MFDRYTGLQYVVCSFSRRAILDQQAVVQEKVKTLCKGLEYFRETGSVFRVTDPFAAFAGDVISQYSFGFSYGQTERYEDGWKENFHDAYISLGAFGHVAVQWPWVNPVSTFRHCWRTDVDIIVAAQKHPRFDYRQDGPLARQDAPAAEGMCKSHQHGPRNSVLTADMPSGLCQDHRDHQSRPNCL